MEGEEMENFVQWLAKNKRRKARLHELVLAFLTMEKRNEKELVEWKLSKG